MNKDTTHFLLQTSYFLMLIAIMMSIYAANSVFVYTLDDPYIHLAVTQNILEGNYGVNPQEFSAPSSSIIWPFLLAFVHIITLGLIPLEFIPLFINVVAGSLLLGVLNLHIKKSFSKTLYPIILLLFAVFLISSANFFGLIFIGMEHSLQILVLASIAYLITNKQRAVESKLLYALLVLAPLVRYENMAVTISVLALLFYKKEYKRTFITILATLLGITSFSLFLYSMDLGILPTSILIKSGAMADSFTALLISKIKGNFVGSIPFTILFGLAIYALIKKSEHKALVVSLLGAMMLHLVFGRTGWFFRYEMYIITYSAFILVYVFKDNISALFSRIRSIWISSFVLFGLVFINILGIITQVLTYQASNNIYRQQYYMGEIAKAYNKPVGVNDLGLVTFSNDNYVLDLYGLGSKEAMRARMSNDAEKIEELAQRYDVGLIMIYDEWFQTLPKSWKKVAILEESRQIVSPIRKTVSFYTTGIDDKNVYEVLQKYKRLHLINE